MRVRLTEKIFRLVNFVCRVHRDKHRTYFRRRPERYVPLRNICRPNGNVASRLHAHCEGIDVVTEFRVGSRVIEGGVFEGVLIGKFIDHCVKHLREGLFDEGVLFPDELARVRLVFVEHRASLGGRGVLRHIPGEVRKHNVGRIDLRHPFGIPLEADKAVEVDALKSVHEIVYRKSSLAHEAVFAVIRRILYVDVLDVCAEVRNRLLGGFSAHTVGVVEVPQSSETVACKVFEKLSQSRGVGIHSHSLDKDYNPCLLRLGQNP